MMICDKCGRKITPNNFWKHQHDRYCCDNSDEDNENAC